MLLTIAEVLAPVFIVSAIGYAWQRAGKPFDTETVGSLVMTIGAPCLVFSSLTGIDLDADTLLRVSGSAVIGIIGMLLVGTALLRLMGEPLRVFLPTLVHPNTGNMGLPLTFMAFGEAGLALGVAYYVVGSVAQYSLGMALASGEARPAQLLRQPVLWAVLASIMVGALDLAVPRFVGATTELVGGFVIPVMLLMLGTSLARLNVKRLGRSSLISGVRLGLGFGLGLLAVALFELEGAVAGVVLIQAAMPSAVFNIVFAERYDNQPEDVAAVILISTLMSFATLPLLTGYALSLDSTIPAT